jgi:hypothetical protein
MSVTIKLRRGVSSEWVSQNIVLASGEPGYEINTGRFKIGNGSTAWNSLSYASVVPTGLLAGSGININLGTNGSTATISASGLTSSYISDFNEAVDDRIGSGLFVAGTGINLNYVDASGTFTVSVSGLVNNPANNRILTSRDNTTTGIDAESNATFDGTTLAVSGAISVDNLKLDGNTLSSTNSNGNIIISPSGTGALQRDSGGNARGQYAVDWQTVRSSGTMVAGVDYSVIGGGRNNSISTTFSGSDNVIGGGYNNSINGNSMDGNVIAGGVNNKMLLGNSDSSAGFFIGGGNNNEINVPLSFSWAGAICGGTNNTIGGDYNRYGFIGGGLDNSLLGYYNYAAFIGGGSSNTISTVGAGYPNFDDSHCVIVGGANNICSGDYSAILGGKNNNDGGRDNIFILGSSITATQNNTTYVQNLDVSTTGDIDVLRINKFYHNNLSVASGLSDTDLLVAVINPTGTSSTEVISGSTLRSSLLNQPATLRFRQGTNAERLLITPASGEPIWTTDSQRFYIGDGSTVGGDLIGPIYKSGTGSNSIVTSFSSTSAASGDYSVVGGGNGNVIKSTADGSVIGGGYDNTVWGPKSFIGGGEGNTTGSSFFGNDQMTHNTICGGLSNSINSGSVYYFGGPVGGSFIGGGAYNSMIGDRNYHVICGGYSNYISAQNEPTATIVGGYNNSISGDYTGGSFIGAGAYNTVTIGYFSTIAGGQGNSIAGTNYGSSIGGGSYNINDGGYSTIPGGLRAKVTRHGELSHAAGRFENNGDAQHTILIARRNTSNATANQILYLDGSSIGIIIPAKTTWTFEVKLSAYNDTDSAGAGWIFRGAIRRDGSNGTAMAGSVIEENWKDAAMSSASANLVANDSGESLDITVTGLASKNIRWVAVVDISQVSYGTP